MEFEDFTGTIEAIVFAEPLTDYGEFLTPDAMVLFGGTGETLRIEHRTTGRECFMPGVLLAARTVVNQKGLVVGLENLL